MATDKQYLLQQAGLIRDEHRAGANTAYRVGSLLVAMVEALSTLSQADLDKIFLHKDRQDSTEYLVQFFAGVTAGMYVPGGSLGSKLHDTGLTEAGKLLVNGLSRFVGHLQSTDWDKGEAGWGITRDADGNTVVEADILAARILSEVYDLAVKNHATFYGSLGSSEFVSGQKGWSIRQREYTNAAGEKEYRSVAEFDDLMVRGIMQVTEFVVNQLLGENDNRIFTGMMEVEYYDAATETLYLSTKGGTLYNPFRADDVIIVQQFGGLNSDGNDNLVTKAYEFVVSEVGVGDTSLGQDRLDWLKFKNFTTPIEGGGLSLIKKGDTLVRYDNLSDDRRKGIIQINSVGDDTPYIDILHGAKTDPDNSVKGRIGNLGGIYHPLFGWLADFGAYLANFYGVGEFVIAHSGENVADAIEIAKGAFRTNFRQSQYDLGEEDNFLTNTNWTNGCEGWTMGADTTSYFLVGDELPQFFNFDLLSTEDSYAGIADLDGRDMLRLANSTAQQANSLIRQPGTHKVYGTPTLNGDGTYSTPYTDVADTLYLSVRVYVPNQESTLEFGFVDESGAFIDNDFHHTETLPVAVTGYSFKLSGTWDGVGDFCIRVTGEAFVDLLTLTDKPLDNFKVTTETSIEQTAQSINLVGKRVSAAESSITNIGISLDAAEEIITLYATKTTNLETSLSQLSVRVDGISSTVSSVQGTANNAVDLANAAQSAADSAASKATTANNAASSAASAAAAAQTTADSAVSKANSAQTTANTANSTANSALSKANANATAISQNKDSISLLAGAFTLQNGKYVLTEAAGVVITNKVATLYATQASVDSLGNRVTAAESSISVNAGNIALKVNKSGVISAINQSAETIKISAAKIELTGKVTFSMLDSSTQSTINGKISTSTLIEGGKIKAEYLNVTEIYATKGTVGGFSIGAKSLTNTAADVSLSIGDLTGYKFVSLNDDNGVLYARNDGGTAVRIYTSSTSGIGLSITAQNSAKAISSTGNVNLTARPSGNELVTIAGLALACKTGTTFTAPTNSSIGNSSAWVDFLIASGNITLPTASSCPGKIIFVKFKGSYRVYCSSPIYKANEYAMYNLSNGQYTDSFSARSLFFVSDGYAWYEFLTYYRS